MAVDMQRTCEKREFFIDNLLVRVHFIIVMIRWTGLAPWEFEFPFPGSLTSTQTLTPSTQGGGAATTKKATTSAHADKEEEEEGLKEVTFLHKVYEP